MVVCYYCLVYFCVILGCFYSKCWYSVWSMSTRSQSGLSFKKPNCTCMFRKSRTINMSLRFLSTRHLLMQCLNKGPGYYSVKHVSNLHHYYDFTTIYPNIRAIVLHKSVWIIYFIFYFVDLSLSPQLYIWLWCRDALTMSEPSSQSLTLTLRPSISGILSVFHSQLSQSGFDIEEMKLVGCGRRTLAP